MRLMITFEQLCKRNGFQEWTSKQTGNRIVQSHVSKNQLIEIQQEALKEAAEIARTFAEDHKTIQPSFEGIRDAILARAKEIDK